MEALVTDESDKSQLLRGKQLKGKWSINGVRWMNPMTWGQWRKICTSNCRQKSFFVYANRP
jgi:hypothetical protein